MTNSNYRAKIHVDMVGSHCIMVYILFLIVMMLCCITKAFSDVEYWEYVASHSQLFFFLYIMRCLVTSAKNLENFN